MKVSQTEVKEKENYLNLFYKVQIPDLEKLRTHERSEFS